jgi:hypothetical protein
VLTTTATANGATTTVSIPVLLLPKEPGRNKMVLPPVPIAVSAQRRASHLVHLPHASSWRPYCVDARRAAQANPGARQQIEVDARQAAHHRRARRRGAGRTGSVAHRAMDETAAAQPPPPPAAAVGSLEEHLPAATRVSPKRSVLPSITIVCPTPSANTSAGDMVRRARNDHP